MALLEREAELAELTEAQRRPVRATGREAQPSTRIAWLSARTFRGLFCLGRGIDSPLRELEGGSRSTRGRLNTDAPFWVFNPPVRARAALGATLFAGAQAWFAELPGQVVRGPGRHEGFVDGAKLVRVEASGGTAESLRIDDGGLLD